MKWYLRSEADIYGLLRAGGSRRGDPLQAEIRESPSKFAINHIMRSFYSEVMLIPANSPFGIFYPLPCTVRIRMFLVVAPKFAEQSAGAQNRFIVAALRAHRIVAVFDTATTSRFTLSPLHSFVTISVERPLASSGLLCYDFLGRFASSSCCDQKGNPI
nr:hypothetical protein Iba_chr10dCG3750 [Ipomoea batatas]